MDETGYLRTYLVCTGRNMKKLGEKLYNWQLHNLYSSPDSLFSWDKIEYDETILRIRDVEKLL